MSTSSSVITVTMSPSTIPANDASTTTATASGFPAADTVVFSSSDPNEVLGATTPGPNGTYTATITSSTTVTTPGSPVTIVATDGTSTGQGSLIQSGPATGVSVALNPTSIVANGASTTVATATVIDANHNPVSGQAIAFIAGAQTVTGADQGNGTYTATINSTTTAGRVTVTAADFSVPGLTGGAQLTQTAGGISVALNPTSIVANGTSTTVATATVTDGAGNRVSGDTVTFTESTGSPAVPGVDQHNGTYTATLESTTTPGPVTVTATDSTAGISGTTTLTQASGVAGNVSLSLSPASLRANGSDTTTATATITDSLGLPLGGQTVVFVPSDPGDTVGAVSSNSLAGTYSATITASNAAGTVQVVAVDVTSGLHGQQQLIQTAGSSTTGLSLVPSQPVTNETETMVATVAPTNFGSPSGSVTMAKDGTPISNCQNLPVTPASPAAACQASFAASDSPVALTAAFTPSGGNLAASTSSIDSLTVGKDSTTTKLTASSANPTTGSTVTYLVSVVPAHAGSTLPSGTVRFTDGTTPLPGCASQPMLHGNSQSAAVCRVSFLSPGTHHITAHYGGDGSFTGSASSSISAVAHRPPPPTRLSSLLDYSFVVSLGSPTTSIATFSVTGVPSGASVQVTCHGIGCPYTKRTFRVSNAKSCKPTSTLRCTERTGNTVDLAAAFRHRRLSIGSQVRVEVLRRGFIGKYYVFTIRARRAPGIRITCLAPGSSKPGVGC